MSAVKNAGPPIELSNRDPALTTTPMHPARARVLSEPSIGIASLYLNTQAADSISPTDSPKDNLSASTMEPEKATDPRRRPRTLERANTEPHAQIRPAYQAITSFDGPSDSGSGDSTPVDSSRDTVMTTAPPEISSRDRLLKQLILLNKSSFNYSKQKSEASALRKVHESQAEKKHNAEINEKQYPSVLKYATIQAQDAEQNYKKAAAKTKGLKPAFHNHAEIMINELLAAVKEDLEIVDPTSDNQAEVKSGIESVRAQFGDHKSTVLQRLVDLEKHAVEVKSSQVNLKQEISEQKTQYKQENTALLKDIKNVTAMMSTAKDLPALTNAKIQAVKIDISQVKRNSSDMEKDVGEMSTTIKQLQDHQANFVPRSEFDSLKAMLEQQSTVMSNLRQELDELKKDQRALVPGSIVAPDPSPAFPNLYVTRYNEDQTLVQKDISSLKRSISTLQTRLELVESSHDKITPIVHESNGMIKNSDGRIDKMIKEFGLLENKVNNSRDLAQLSTHPAYPSPPASTQQKFPDNLEAEFQKHFAATNTQVSTLTNLDRANSHAIRQLNSRYNNLTSEGLARYIGGIVYPVIPALQQEQAEMKNQVQHLGQAMLTKVSHQEHSQLRAQVIEIAKSTVENKESNVKTKALQEHVNKIYKELSSTTASQLTDRTNAISSVDKAREELLAEVQTLEVGLDAEKLRFDAFNGEFKDIVEKITTLNGRIIESDTRPSPEVADLQSQVAAIDNIIQGHRRQLQALDDVTKETKQSTAGLSDSLQGLMDTAIEKSRLDCLKQSIKIIQDVQSALSGISSPAPATTDAHNRLAKSVNDLRARVIEEKTALCKRIDDSESSIRKAHDLVNALEARTDTTDLRGQLKAIEDALDSLRATSKKHGETLEAMNTDLIREFQAPPRGPKGAASIRNSVSSTPKATSSNPSNARELFPPSTPRPDSKVSLPLSARVSYSSNKRQAISPPLKDPARGQKRARNNEGISYRTMPNGVTELLSDDEIADTGGNSISIRGASAQQRRPRQALRGT